MDSMLQLFIVLVLTGLLLLGAEIYLPGGVVGVIGVLALIGAMGAGFGAFGIQGGMVAAVAIIVMSGLFLFIWIKLFPKTSAGRRMTLSQDGKSFKAAEDYSSLVGKEGEAVSDLRPAGIALIDGRRMDVIADGTWITAKGRIVVSAVEGNRILVKPAKPKS
jgi:membrane-bound serine protease (ClpP class)